MNAQQIRVAALNAAVVHTTPAKDLSEELPTIRRLMSTALVFESWITHGGQLPEEELRK